MLELLKITRWRRLFERDSEEFVDVQTAYRRISKYSRYEVFGIKESLVVLPCDGGKMIVVCWRDYASCTSACFG